MAKFKDLSPAEQSQYRDNMRHSAAHVLAEAVLTLFPDAQLTIGPPIEDGFYYDFSVENPFTPDDLEDRKTDATVDQIEYRLCRERSDAG